MLLRLLLVTVLLYTFSSSNKALPPSSLKKDVKAVCACYNDFIDLEAKNFPTTSPYYQEALAKATTALVQVEKHIEEELYSKEAFNKMMKKKCPDVVKKLQSFTANPERN